MTKAQAIYQWLASFELPVYLSSSVPNKAEYPYMTYDMNVGVFGDGDSAMTVNLFYRGTSEGIPNAKAEEMSADIGRSGKLLACDHGAIWLKRGQPFWQSINNTDDADIRQRYINIDIDWLTID